MPIFTVPGYADIRELGHSGQTRLGRHTSTGVPVVVRFSPTDGDGQRDRARRLVDLSCTHVARIYEYLESGDGVATVREYVDGVPLATLRTPLHPEAALSVLHAGLVALAAAHAVGATHGGYAAESVLVDRSGRCVLVDFDLLGTGAPADDTARALAMFVARTDRLPRRLRPLSSASAPSAGELAATVDRLGRVAIGADWDARGRRRLAQLVRSAQR